MDAQLRRLLTENEQLRSALHSAIRFAHAAESCQKALADQRDSLFRQLEAENAGLREELDRIRGRERR